MIERIELANYGPFKSTTVELGALTVLVGPNASGKTKLLEAFHITQRRGKPSSYSPILMGINLGGGFGSRRKWSVTSRVVWSSLAVSSNWTPTNYALRVTWTQTSL